VVGCEAVIAMIMVVIVRMGMCHGPAYGPWGPRYTITNAVAYRTWHRCQGSAYAAAEM